MMECPYCHKRFDTFGLFWRSDEHNELECWRENTFGKQKVGAVE